MLLLGLPAAQAAERAHGREDATRRGQGRADVGGAVGGAWKRAAGAGRARHRRPVSHDRRRARSHHARHSLRGNPQNHRHRRLVLFVSSPNWQCLLRMTVFLCLNVLQ